MRAAFEIIRSHQESSLNCRRITGETFGTMWHFHPEIELMFVERSRGMRFVGDHVAPYAPGDLVLLGPNLPHVWLTNDMPARPRHDHAISIFLQFREDFLGRAFWRTPEFAAVAALLQRSRHGVHFTGRTARLAARQLRRIVKLSGVERIAALLALLALLAGTREQRLLCRAGYVPKLNRAEARRINAACRYARTQLTRAISQPKAAALARLSPTRFSAFFRQKMGCTFSAYVNRLRIARVVHLLTEEKMNISEACFASGFNNLSNFNHQFRAVQGMTPRAYLRHFHTNAGAGDVWLTRDAWIR